MAKKRKWIHEKGLRGEPAFGFKIIQVIKETERGFRAVIEITSGTFIGRCSRVYIPNPLFQESPC